MTDTIYLTKDHNINSTVVSYSEGTYFISHMACNFTRLNLFNAPHNLVLMIKFWNTSELVITSCPTVQN
jgi:hypothetical protein